MKKASRIILIIAGVLLIVVGFLFSVIEGRLLFSLDYSLYAYSGLAFARALFRFLAALATFSTGILPFLELKKERPILRIYLYIGAILVFLLGNLYSTLLKEMPGPNPLYLTLPFSLFGDLYFIGAGLDFLFRNEKGPGEGPATASGNAEVKKDQQ